MWSEGQGQGRRAAAQSEEAHRAPGSPDPERLILLVSGPSGSGKSTLIRRLLEADPGVGFSVSVTTRPPRAGEVDGQHYHFVSKARFLALREQGAFLEWARVYGHLYGTPASEVSRLHQQGQDALFDLDVQGGRALMARFPEVVSVFVLPPAYAELRTRLLGRGTDAPQVVETRLAQVREQSEGYQAYRYVVINQDLERAAEELRAVVLAERARTARRRDRAAAILASFPPGDGASRPEPGSPAP